MMLVFVEASALGERRVAVAEDAPMMRAPMGLWIPSGPSDGPGLIVAEADEPADRARYIHGAQEWAPVGLGRWIGWWRGERPTPEMLARPVAERIDGPAVMLEDGHEWTLPRLMLPTGHTGLPAALGLTRDGKLQRAPLARYRELAARGRKLWEFVSITLAGGTPRETITDEEILAIVIDGLAVNYRVDREMVTALGIISERNLLLVACEMVGIREMREALENAGKEVPAPG